MANDFRDKVFVSYSRDEKKWLDLLLKTLSPLIRSKPNTIWWDGLIKAGQEWEEEIRRNLASAKVAVLLVSPGFLASEFILKEELPKILEAAKTEGVAVLWSLVRNCWWENSALYHYQAVPHQQTHTMRAWNTLSETELEDLLVVVAKEIDDRLRSDAVVPDAVPPAPAPAPSSSPRAEAAHAEILLKDVDDLKTVDEIGNLFVLRQSWSAAEVAYDSMVELAAPHQELWMAWGYEKLGLIYERQKQWQHAGECAKLAQILYGRIGRDEKAAEMGLRLQKIAAPPVTPSA